MKIYKKINPKGFTHIEAALVIVFLFAIAGTYYLVKSHAQSAIHVILAPYTVQVDANVPGTIAISWDQSTSQGVTGYKVLRNNQAVATTTNTSYIDTSVQPNTEYDYSVVSLDSTNNTLSVASDPVDVTSDYSTVPPLSTSNAATPANISESISNSASKSNTNPTINYLPGWSGYLIDASNATFTGVVATFKVPDVTSCTVLGSSAGFWVGFGGTNGISGLEQDGIGQQCQPNNHKQLHSRYTAWTEMFPAPPIIANLRVSPGDIVTAKATYGVDVKFHFSITNNTTNVAPYNASFYCATNINCATNITEWIIERSGVCINASCSQARYNYLSDYGSTVVKNASIQIYGGSYKPLGSYPNNVIDMENLKTKKHLNATTHPLSDTATSFSSQWLGAN